MNKMNFLHYFSFEMNYPRYVSEIYIYIRVSTEKQVNENGINCIGIQAQVNICKKFINARLSYLNKIPIVISDVGSTFNNQKAMKNFDQLMENLSRYSLILVTDVSRLGRNIYHSFRNYETIEKNNSFIISVNDNKMFGDIRSNDIHFFNKSIEAESFSLEKSINMKARNEIIREAGGHIGGFPFGMMRKKREKWYS